MNIEFYKYQGAGNDFIIIDNFNRNISLSTPQIEKLCDRHFGIGADGLMFLEKCTEANFKMVYYNADGNESTMCGNGGRCIAALAFHLKYVSVEMTFLAIDGLHHAKINKDQTVSLAMKDVHEIIQKDNHWELDTGSPHYIQYVDNIQNYDVVKTGREIRNNYSLKGINVNFIKMLHGELYIRTYERGVENETLACGTGVTAATLVASNNQIGDFIIPVVAQGGKLSVSFSKNNPTQFTNIWLTGGAELVFQGNINI